MELSLCIPEGMQVINLCPDGKKCPLDCSDMVNIKFNVNSV